MLAKAKEVESIVTCGQSPSQWMSHIYQFIFLCRGWNSYHTSASVFTLSKYSINQKYMLDTNKSWDTLFILKFQLPKIYTERKLCLQFIFTGVCTVAHRSTNQSMYF